MGKYDHLADPLPREFVAEVDASEELVRYLEGIPPGRGAILVVPGSAQEFIVVRLEDFDYLVGLAGLKRKGEPG